MAASQSRISRFFSPAGSTINPMLSDDDDDDAVDKLDNASEESEGQPLSEQCSRIIDFFGVFSEIDHSVCT